MQKADQEFRIRLKDSLKSGVRDSVNLDANRRLRRAFYHGLPATVEDALQSTS